MKINPRLILLDPEVQNLEMTQKVCRCFPNVKLEIVTPENTREVFSEQKSNAKTIGKSILYLAKKQGRMIKDCPGTNYYLCCGYKVLNSIENCSMECSYCILQNYLTSSLIRIHPQTDKMFLQIDQLLKSAPDRLFRIGSGELSDSLLYDEITEFSSLVARSLKNYSNVLFEFKTKTTNVDHLLQLECAPQNIVVGWTLNTPKIIESEEKKTASLDARLKAASMCAQKGYKISFHFDPIIIYENYITEYQMVIDQIFANVAPQSIAWISLGMFRYPPNLYHVIKRRFPKTRIIYGEAVHGNDGKIRYFKKHRIQTFGEIYHKIYQYTLGKVFVYLCMESPEIWKKTFGFTPVNNDEFCGIFNRHLIEKFNIPCKN